MKKIFDVIYLEINDIRDIININNKYYYLDLNSYLSY